MSPPGGVELGRAELLWVVEQCGGDAWPYPLLRSHWPAETERESALHRARAEDRLRERGLLAPESAAFLLALGQVVRDWSVAVDLVVRTAEGPAAEGRPNGPAGWGRPAAARAVVAVSDGHRGMLLASADHDTAPVGVWPVRPDRLPEAVLGLVGPIRPGAGPTVGVPAEVLAPPAAAPAGTPPGADGPGPDPDAPGTRRSVEARRHVRRLVDTADGWAIAGVAVRAPNDPHGPPGVPARRAPLVMWLDGPHGTHRVVHDPRGGAARALVAPVDHAVLAADLHRLVGDVPPPSGRRTA